MACNYPKVMFRSDPFPHIFPIPCGKCAGCRKDAVTMWSDRIEFETLTSEKPSTFLTLTYDEKYLPKDRSVRLKDVQDFFKRFRYYCAERGVSRFRYFVSSEYGDTTFRPHYHICLCNVDCYSHVDFSCFFDAWRDPDTKEPIGILTADGLLPARIRYCVSYINNLTPQMARVYKALGLKKPFHAMSKGIGLDWMTAHYDDLVASQGYYHEGVLRPLPRYYQLKLGLDEKNSYLNRLNDIWSKYNEKLAFNGLPLVDPCDVNKFMRDYDHADPDIPAFYNLTPKCEKVVWQFPDAAVNEARELKLLHKQNLHSAKKSLKSG